MAVDLYAEEPLRMSVAAELLGISTLEMVELVYHRKIRYALVDGIPRVPRAALDEYRHKALGG